MNTQSELLKVVEDRIEVLFDRKIKKENKSRMKRLALIAAFASVIGIGVFGTLTNYLIEKAVDYKLEQTAGDIKSSVEFSKFYTITSAVHLGDGYSNEDVVAIMQYLRSIENNEKIRNSDEFAAALVKVMISLVQNGSNSVNLSIDEIYEEYGREIHSSPILVELLANHYGQKIISERDVNLNSISKKNFETLKRSADEDTSLAYQILYEVKRGSHNDEIKKLLSRSTKFSSKMRVFFFNSILDKSRSENWVNNHTTQSLVFEELVRKFFARHGTDIIEVYGLDNDKNEWTDIFDEISSFGISSEGATNIAQMISISCENCPVKE